MNTLFPVATFADVFEPVRRDCILEDAVEYSLLGVSLEGRGAFLRERKPGLLIKRKRQWFIKEGDVVYNKLFAWRGAFAVATREVDGCIASDKFPAYRIKNGKVIPDYVRYWFRTQQLALAARRLSKGAAALSKLTLNPPDFWKMPIPLPDTDVQQTIVSKLDHAFSILNTIGSLSPPTSTLLQGQRGGIGARFRFFVAAALHDLQNAFPARGRLDEILVERPRSGPSFPVSESGSGVAVVMPSAILGYRFCAAKCLFGDGTEYLTEKDIVRSGDILIARGNYRDQVGICAVYNEGQPRTYANLLMKMRAKKGFEPEFVKFWLMTPLARKHIEHHTKGTSPSVQKINQRGIVATPFPTDVPISEQRRWVNHLTQAVQKTDEILGLAVKQQAEFSALRKSLLAASFRGEL